MAERNCERTTPCATTPCAKCPYRKDAPLAFWHVDHFVAVLNSEGDPLGSVWNCHTKDGGVCVGWALDQRQRDFPNTNLRLAMRSSHMLREQLTQKIHSGGLEMYPTVREMCADNILAILRGRDAVSEEIDVPATDLRRAARRTRKPQPKDPP